MNFVMLKKALIVLVSVSFTFSSYTVADDIGSTLKRQYETVTTTMEQVLSELPAQLLKELLASDPYSKKVAHVRYTPSDDVGAEEKEFIQHRLPVNQIALQKYLGVKLTNEKTPVVAIAFSGGGFRAMTATSGFIKGAEKTGLLDGCRYLAGLSGSTWSIAPWIASEKSMADYLDGLSIRLKNGIEPLLPSATIRNILAVLIAKLLHGQPISAMDIYGDLLGNILLRDLGNDRFRITLTDSQDAILDGRYPLPIYTAVDTTNQPYEWIEVTPFEVGGTYLQSYVPTWAFGRQFVNGVSTNKAPELTLDYFMAIFGSAFEANLKDAIEHSADVIDLFVDQLPSVFEQFFGKSSTYSILAGTLKSILPSVLKNALAEWRGYSQFSKLFEEWSKYLNFESWSKLRFFPDQQPNFTFKLPATPLRDETQFTLVDAGFSFNLPLPPLLRPARNVDVLIIYDTSLQGDVQNSALKKAEEYARRNKLKFPPINYKRLFQSPVSVFKDETDPDVPTVIYFPLIANTKYDAEFDPQNCIRNSYCATLNFAYSPEQVHELAGLGEFTASHYADVIKNAVREKIKSKS